MKNKKDSVKCSRTSMNIRLPAEFFKLLEAESEKENIPVHIYVRKLLLDSLEHGCQKNDKESVNGRKT